MILAQLDVFFCVIQVAGSIHNLQLTKRHFLHDLCASRIVMSTRNTENLGVCDTNAKWVYTFSYTCLWREHFNGPLHA